MADKHDDGGPAYPVERTYRRRPRYGEEGDQIVTEHNDGMSMLDWFAGQATVGMVAEISGEQWGAIRDGTTYPLHKEVARFIYDLAEALVAEKRRREK